MEYWNTGILYGILENTELLDYVLQYWMLGTLDILNIKCGNHNFLKFLKLNYWE